MLFRPPRGNPRGTPVARKFATSAASRARARIEGEGLGQVLITHMTDDEKTAFQQLRLQTLMNPGQAIPLPPICRQALARIMAPMNALIDAEILRERRRQAAAAARASRLIID